MIAMQFVSVFSTSQNTTAIQESDMEKCDLNAFYNDLDLMEEILCLLVNIHFRTSLALLHM